MNEQRFPKGWDEQRIKHLIAELDANGRGMGRGGRGGTCGGGYHHDGRSHGTGAGSSCPSCPEAERLSRYRRHRSRSHLRGMVLASRW